MAKTQNKGEKLYFTVGEIASMLGVNESLIRFWNKEFDQILNPHRNKRGVRYFSQTDVETYKRIYHLVKEKGYTLPGALESLKSGPPVDDEKIEVIQTLKTIKQFLIELKDEI
ncbi:MAG: MerR family transcriptional regulator [Bacteroidota bacterium]|nr:MerR family transcriptional regulator [Bacteroidota bacterium]